MRKIARTHDENREKLCLLCLEKDTRSRKKSFVKILPRGKLEEMIKSNFKYNANDNRLPNAICEGCRKKLYRVKNGSTTSINSPNLKQFYDNTGITTRKTRQSKNERCKCRLCEIVQAPLIQMKESKFVITRRKIRKPFDWKPRKAKTIMKVCEKCCAVIKPGTLHKCRKSLISKNVKSLVQKALTEKGSDQIISSLLKDKVKETNSRDVAIRCTVGKPLRVSVNPSKNSLARTEILTVNDVQKIQSSFGLSQRTTLGLASMLRSANKNRKSIEPNLKTKLAANLHSLDTFFEVKLFDFTVVKANKVTHINQYAVYCTNLNGLIEYAKEKRGVSNVHLTFGIDGGGGFLKLSLTMQSVENDSISETSRQKYKNGIASKKFRDSGVKKLFIIGIAPSLQENYGNVSTLWSAIDINSFNGTFAVDLKLANIISGLMSHSSARPCTYCLAPKNDLKQPAECRTIRNIIENYNEWCKAGSKPSAAKKFMNCVHEPLYTRDDTETPIVKIIPPPELHLLLGVVNTIFNYMLIEYNDIALNVS